MITDSLEYQNSSQTEYKKSFSVVLIMVCIYIFLIIERPWESIRYLEGIPIERVYAILLILVAFIQQKFKIVSSPTNKWVYSLLATHFVLSPFAYNPEYAVNQGIEYTKLVVLYLLMLSVADDKEALKILVKAYIFSMLFYMLHSLWEYHNGRVEWRMGISRMLGVDQTYNDPNAFGASVVLSLSFVYALFRTEVNNLYRKLYYLYFILAVVCIVLTGSRTSFVALLFLCFLWVFFQQGARKFKILAIVLPMLFIVWSVMPQEKQNRIRTLWDEEAGPANATESAKGRLEGWNVSWRMFKQVPFTGVGAGGKNFIGYRIANKIDDEGHESPTQSHVLYGEVLAELGIFGALLFCGLVASIARCSFVVRQEVATAMGKSEFYYLLSNAILASLLLLLVLGFGGHNFYRPLWLWLAAWSGSLLMIVQKKNQQAGLEQFDVDQGTNV